MEKTMTTITRKTEVIVFGAKEERLKVSTQFQSVMLKTADQARNLGVVMDLNLNSHNKTITYYILQGRPIIT